MLANYLPAASVLHDLSQEQDECRPNPSKAVQQFQGGLAAKRTPLTLQYCVPVRYWLGERLRRLITEIQE